MDTTPAEFTVETRKARPTFRPFMGPYDDFFEARRVAASLIESQGVQARVTDRDGQVWA